MSAFRSALVPLLLLVVGCMPSKEALSSGEVGCSPDSITISQDRYHFGLVQSSESWVATCHGRSFVCSQLNETGDDEGIGALLAAKRVSCTEEVDSPQAEKNAAMYVEAQRRAAIPPPPAPVAAAGFEFGTSFEQAQQLCEEAGYRWSAVNAQEGTCSGPAKALGMDASVALRFCDGQVCNIFIEHRPTSGWPGYVTSLKAKLTSKYGNPKKRSRGIPTACRSDEQFERCLETRELKLHYGWEWPSGEVVDMNVGKSETAERASIRLNYRRGSAVRQSEL